MLLSSGVDTVTAGTNAERSGSILTDISRSQLHPSIESEILMFPGCVLITCHSALPSICAMMPGVAEITASVVCPRRPERPSTYCGGVGDSSWNQKTG